MYACMHVYVCGMQLEIMLQMQQNQGCAKASTLCVNCLPGKLSCCLNHDDNSFSSGTAMTAAAAKIGAISLTPTNAPTSHPNTPVKATLQQEINHNLAPATDSIFQQLPNTVPVASSPTARRPTTVTSSDSDTDGITSDLNLSTTTPIQHEPNLIIFLRFSFCSA